MPAERVSMRQICEILRLNTRRGATKRAIARSIGVARSIVALTLERVAAVRLGWPRWMEDRGTIDPDVI